MGQKPTGCKLRVEAKLHLNHVMLGWFIMVSSSLFIHIMVWVKVIKPI
jgi:hypothetical protein